MKTFCKYLVISGAIMGAAVGAASSYLTAVMLKNKATMGEIMKCKSKEAFKCFADKFSL